MNEKLLRQVITAIPNMKAKPMVDGISTRLYRNDSTNTVNAYVQYQHAGARRGKEVTYTFDLLGHEFTKDQTKEVLGLVNQLLHSITPRFASQYDAQTRSDWQDDELDSFWNKLYEDGDAQVIKELKATTVTTLEEAQTAMEKLPMSIIDWELNKVNLDELMNFKYRREFTSIFGTITKERRLSYAKLITLEVHGNTDLDLVTNIVPNRTMRMYNKGIINTIWVPLFIKNDFIAIIAYKDTLDEFVQLLKDSDFAGISTELSEVIKEFTYLKDVPVTEADHGDWARQTLTRVLGKLRRTISVLKSEPENQIDQDLLAKLDEFIRENLGSVMEDLQMVQDISDSLKLNALTEADYSMLHRSTNKNILKQIFWKKVTRRVKAPSNNFKLLAETLRGQQD